MKVIPLSEAKAHLSEYAHRCHDEPIVVTVNGRPAFQLVPLKKDDDLIDRLVEHHPGFRRLLQRRLRERSVPAAVAARRLAPRRRARPRSRP
jgi:prevent-host-death family protein